MTAQEKIWVVVVVLGYFSAVIIVFAICSVVVIHRTIQSRSSTADEIAAMVPEGSGLKMFALVSVVVAVFVLGLFELISRDGVMSTLTGVLGFVLGDRTSRQSGTDSPTPNLPRGTGIPPHSTDARP